jgi:hypothetical protein
MKEHIWIVAVPLAIVNLVAVIFGRPVPGALNYGVAVFIAADLLANAFAGGNPKVTISARVGYRSRQEEKMTSVIWKLCENIINETFKAIDGPDHCWNAYVIARKRVKLATNSSLHINHGPVYMLYVLATIVVVSCVVIYLPIKAISFFSRR